MNKKRGAKNSVFASTSDISSTIFRFGLFGWFNMMTLKAATTEKPPEMSYWNLLCLRRFHLLVNVFSVSKNKITKPYAKKYDGLLVNDDKIVI